MNEDGFVVFDIEIKKTIQDKREFNKPWKLGFGLGVVYCSKEDEYKTFLEDNIGSFFSELISSPTIVSFNGKRFDLPLLKAYVRRESLEKLNMRTKHIDIMDEITKVLGHRISLVNVSKATLGRGKTMDGAEAPELLRQGKIKEVEEYCMNDVRLTKEIYEFGKENKFVKYLDKNTSNAKEVNVQW